MGAVRVTVKLTNGSDEALVRTGQLRPEDVRGYETEALVDTGSVETVIPVAVMKQLGLPSMDRRRPSLRERRRPREHPSRRLPNGDDVLRVRKTQNCRSRRRKALRV